jgi:disulfide oxidoreductase YuzD
LEDGKGKKWYRASNLIRRYYPRLDFTTEYLDLMRRIDAQVPTGREIAQRFVEQVYQAPSFVTVRIAEKLMRSRRTVGFVPADKPLRFNL